MQKNDDANDSVKSSIGKVLNQKQARKPESKRRSILQHFLAL
jgi:hypothetical protein